MNLNDLTIGDAKTLAAMFSSPSATTTFQAPLGKKCIVRTYASGVHFGTLEAQEGRQVKLTNARRLWKWHAASGISLSEVAVHGINAGNSKVCEVVPEIYITDALEIIPASDVSVNSIETAAVYQP